MPRDSSPFPYVAPPGLKAPEPKHPVIIVGAGPVGLAMALELANHGVKSVVLDDNDVVSIGSRAICWSKRSLEILDRLGIGPRCIEKGVTWKVGRTFHRDQEVFRFDLLPEAGHKMPAFVNLQQYYVEQFLVEAAQNNALVDLRFRNSVTDVAQNGTHSTVSIQTNDGCYTLDAEYLIACDGANSAVRSAMGLDFAGEFFEERFLIADIELDADQPAERWFWFQPTFHPGQSALLHKQPDNIFRIDLQLGWDADPKVERLPENVIPRIAKVVGHNDFRLDWVSVYKFQCRRLRDFVHDRVIFIGDSAHVVSPFGARGANGGLQDVDALGWRLAAVLDGRAPDAVLADFNLERTQGADENLMNSARATKFMTPADGIERLFRDQVLALSEKVDFAKSWVNSGRLSEPCVYRCTGADDAALPRLSRPGAVAPDAPLGRGWLIDTVGGRAVVLAIGSAAPQIEGIECISLEATEIIRQRYLAEVPTAFYLIRPDQVIAARWPYLDSVAIKKAISDMWGRT